MIRLIQMLPLFAYWRFKRLGLVLEIRPPWGREVGEELDKIWLALKDAGRAFWTDDANGAAGGGGAYVRGWPSCVCGAYARDETANGAWSYVKGGTAGSGGGSYWSGGAYARGGSLWSGGAYARGGSYWRGEFIGKASGGFIARESGRFIGGHGGGLGCRTWFMITGFCWIGMA